MQTTKELLDSANLAANSGDMAEAEALYRQFLEYHPDHPQSLFNVATLVQNRANSPKLRVESASLFERCISSPHVDPETASNALNNFGNLMECVGRTDKAAIAYHLAVQLHPDSAAAHTNLGDALRWNLKFEEADREYAEALKLNPDHPESHMARGMLALLFGDYKRGWDEYEWRFQTRHFPTKPFVSERPLWRGEDLEGRRILLTTEQGFGDNIQFIRYARELKRRWPTCIVKYYGHASLMDLFAEVDGLDECFAAANDEAFDFHLPILSVPHRLGTTLSDMPDASPYILRAPKWDCQKRDRFTIGLVWAGSPIHGKDKARSVPASTLQPIVDAHPECDFISLQFGAAASQLADLRNVSPPPVTLSGWLKTAELVKSLDLLISVDTAPVHLAGAVGTSCYMLTPLSPDWRWMLGKHKSPWYPKLRLFRQTKADDWSQPVQRIIQSL